jgi:hypothetical protein
MPLETGNSRAFVFVYLGNAHDESGLLIIGVGFSQRLVFQGEIDDIPEFLQGLLLLFRRAEDEAEDRLLEGLL